MTSRHLFVDSRMTEPEAVKLGRGSVAVFSAPRPEAEKTNQDAALCVQLAEESGVLAVADGAGGQAAGHKASATALQALLDSLESGEEVSFREAILRGFDAANRAVAELGVGAATTLALVQIEGRTVRSFHVGDSMVLGVGQRGKRKLETIDHSPAGYAVHAGVVDEAQALHHEERHIVSNFVGSPDMRVDMSAPLELAPRDTVLLASDGLSDNLHVEELVEFIRAGPLGQVAQRLADAAQERMTSSLRQEPSKPDDLTFLVYRPLS